MRQAELCDWALDPALFTSLCDSLNRFFTQRGMITSGSNSPLALGAPHSLQVPPFTPNAPPTLASLTHPSPLSYAPIAPSSSGAQLPRRPVHMQGHRPPQAHPGKTSTPNVFHPAVIYHAQELQAKFHFHLSRTNNYEFMFLCLSRDATSVHGPTAAASSQEPAQQQRGDPGWLWLGFFAHLISIIVFKAKKTSEPFRRITYSQLASLKPNRGFPCSFASQSFCGEEVWEVFHESVLILSFKRSCIVSPFKFICCNFCEDYLLLVTHRVLLFLIVG